MLNPREKNLLYRKTFFEEDGTHDAASSRAENPAHYQRAIPARCQLTLSAAESKQHGSIWKHAAKGGWERTVLSRS